ncbi:MAG TPA: hypothetical protein ENI05_13485 [Porticoccus sp.]|nr:hypothetical protein [Porticoccus sp.]
MSLISYVSLAEMQQQWITGNDSAAAEFVMIDYARRATGKVNLITRQCFSPRIDTINYTATLKGRHISNKHNRLYLRDKLVELTSVILADNTELVIDTDVSVRPKSGVPASMLQMLAASTSSWLDTGGNDPYEGIKVKGVWCWRERYVDEGWQTTNDAVADAEGISNTVTSITVADVEGISYLGGTPRFSMGQMIKVGSEYMAVVGVNVGDKKLTVIRGIRGSTAAEHDVEAPILVFVPEYPIIRATQLIAAYDYQRRGVTTRAKFDGIRTVSGVEVPEEVAAILKGYIVKEIK